MVDTDRAPLGSPFALEATAADQVDVTVSKRGANEDLFVAYTDNRNGNPDLYGERNTPPIAGFIATPARGNALLTVVFTDTATAPHGVSGWHWYCGDGVTSTLQNPSHQYLAVGSHPVALTISSGLEADRATHIITVNTPVSAQFAAGPVSGAKPLTVTFTDQSNTTCGALNSWLWDFGDGVTSTEQHPVPVYPSLGNYTVVLTASTGIYSDAESRAGYVTVTPPMTTVISYAYDSLYRVTQAAYSSGESFDYQYDPVGNRLAYTKTLSAQVVTTYTYDAANRLASVNGQTYTWDDNPTPLRCEDFAVIWSAMARRPTLSRKKRAGPAAIKQIN